MMKSFLLLLFIFSISLTVKANQTIRLTTGEWSPYLSEDLKHYGFVSHIVTEAFALEGIKVEYIFRPWKRAYKDALVGKYHGSIVWTKNPEREQYFYYSDLVVAGQSVFFHLKSFSFDWQNPEDLVGLNIGGTLGYKYSLLEELEAQGKINIHRVATDEQSYGMLLLKRIDIFQQDLDAGYEWLQDNLMEQDIAQFTHHPKPIINDNYHLILSKEVDDNQHLMTLFNRGLKRLKKSGKYQQYISESRQGHYK
ncbi:ABC transporter substrate-binding protein [Psychromonas marina]|uniref:ABC transporter substrate-binding protein n=1 Tax=Psychromonas marina TaxID=88364 RepID=A0ABQ6E3T7_9GAMM|nr:transporter substrate-binding domain-containing protein [Psychromonas marina]GLS92119.1 ABC transporter substrate-binding protein [Psychromonas marina]